MASSLPTGDTSTKSPRNNQEDAKMGSLRVPYEMRNAESVHAALLKESEERSAKINANAQEFLRTLLATQKLNDLKLEADNREEFNKIQCQQLEQEARIQEQEAIKLEHEKKLEEAKRQRREAENALKSMPPLPPRVKTPPPTETPKATAELSTEQSASKPATSTPAQVPPASQSGASNPFAAPPSTTPQSNPTTAPSTLFAPKTQQTTPSAPQAGPSQPNGHTLSANQQGKLPETNGSNVPSGAGFLNLVDQADNKRYAEIHQALKNLRKHVRPPGNGTSELKVEAGRSARAIRASVGQLHSANKGNGNTFAKLRDIFKASFVFSVPGPNGNFVPTIDPSHFVSSVPPPLEDANAKNNGPELPTLFLYLLSAFVKVLVSQVAQEACSKPETAEPIALAAHQVFSHPDLLWRGVSLIDILIAKLRKSCGTLFGFRGSENTEEGRAIIGWKKEDGNWIPEASHYDRQRGIGAFYAGLCLRQYKNRVNPYPPHHYWRSLASMLCCPLQERSNTSYYVLIAMIYGHEQKFFNFYGDMARHALHAALVDYPKNADQNNVAVKSLITLGEKLQHEGCFTYPY